MLEQNRRTAVVNPCLRKRRAAIEEAEAGPARRVRLEEESIEVIQLSGELILTKKFK